MLKVIISLALILVAAAPVNAATLPNQMISQPVPNLQPSANVPVPPSAPVAIPPKVTPHGFLHILHKTVKTAFKCLGMCLGAIASGAAMGSYYGGLSPAPYYALGVPYGYPPCESSSYSCASYQPTPSYQPVCHSDWGVGGGNSWSSSSPSYSSTSYSAPISSQSSYNSGPSFSYNSGPY